MKHFLQWLLIKAMIVKWSGKKTANGKYVTEGLNKKNPFSYLFLIVASLIAGLIAFFKTIYESWEDSLG